MAKEADTAPDSPEQKMFRVLISQFNIEADVLGRGFWQDEVHAAEAFGEELDRLVEMGVIEAVK
jgi:hypothetical protein